LRILQKVKKEGYPIVIEIESDNYEIYSVILKNFVFVVKLVSHTKFQIKVKSFEGGIKLRSLKQQSMINKQKVLAGIYMGIVGQSYTII